VGFIVPEFGLGEWELGLVVGAPTLGGIIASLSGTVLADLYGRKRMLVALTSFVVQFVFPWELAQVGNAAAFFIYALFGVIAIVLLGWLLPETKGRSLEQLETLFGARGPLDAGGR
jgi:MFS family permease